MIAARLEGWAGRLRRLEGWRRLGVAALLGLLAAAALPPVYLLPALVPAFVGLIWLLDGAATRKAAFGIGWAFAAGTFLAGLYWVGIAMTVDFAAFWWFMPISVGGLSVGLALFVGAATLAARRSGLWQGPARVLVLAAAWLVAEWLRSWVLTGFPWNMIGSVWGFSALTLQPAALGGVWLLSALTLVAAGAGATLCDPGSQRRRWALPAIAGALLVVAFGSGWVRLAAAPPPGEPAVADIRLRLVQPGIPQHLKWQRELRLEHLRTQAELSQAPGREAVTHVIWPETAVPFLIAGPSALLEQLGRLARPGTVFVTGAPTVEGQGRAARTYNSVLALAADGTVAARYHKVTLVPFGEYVPFRQLLGMGSIAGGRRDFTPGPALRTLELPGLPPVGPLICYEVIFSGKVTGAERPDWLLNLTNDAWFGTSSGPYQHFVSARLRAVEEGLPLVRAANTGISAVVDPYGRVVARLGLNAVGVLDADLPRPLAPTPYAAAGHWTLVPLLALLLGGALLGRRGTAASAALHTRR